MNVRSRLFKLTQKNDRSLASVACKETIERRAVPYAVVGISGPKDIGLASYNNAVDLERRHHD